MEDLLSLPADQQRLYSICHAYIHSREQPAPAMAAVELGSVTSSTFFGTIECDSFEAARVLVEAGWSPAVLNMANELNCGGAWCTHGGSQEEDLFRTSSLALSLWPRRRSDDRRFPEFEDRFPRSEAFSPWSEAQ